MDAAVESVASSASHEVNLEVRLSKPRVRVELVSLDGHLLHILNARLDKRRAAIAAFERFLDIEGQAGDPDLRRQASSLLQELRRGLN